MPTIEIELQFEEGKLFTTMEAEDVQGVINRLNRDFPALQLTTGNIISWEYVQKQG